MARMIQACVIFKVVLPTAHHDHRNVSIKLLVTKRPDLLLWVIKLNQLHLKDICQK